MKSEQTTCPTCEACEAMKRGGATAKRIKDDHDAYTHQPAKQSEPEVKYVYVTYDARYHFDPDSAAVMETSRTLKEAQKHRTDYGDDCVIVRDKIINGVARYQDSEVMPNE